MGHLFATRAHMQTTLYRNMVSHWTAEFMVTLYTAATLPGYKKPTPESELLTYVSMCYGRVTYHASSSFTSRVFSCCVLMVYTNNVGNQCSGAHVGMNFLEDTLIRPVNPARLKLSPSNSCQRCIIGYTMWVVSLVPKHVLCNSTKAYQSTLYCTQIYRSLTSSAILPNWQTVVSVYMKRFLARHLTGHSVYILTDDSLA